VLGARYRECIEVIHRHLCEGRVPLLTLMGSDIDVLKLQSSLKLFLKVSSTQDAMLQVQAKAVLKVLR
jgi:uncharacterized protein (DUF1810 family)